MPDGVLEPLLFCTAGQMSSDATSTLSEYQRKELGVSENRGTLLGIPIMRIALLWGILRVPLLGEMPSCPTTKSHQRLGILQDLGVLRLQNSVLLKLGLLSALRPKP